MKSSWQTKKLGEVCDVVGGGTPRTEISKYWNGDLCWVTPKNLGWLEGFEISDTDRKISEEGLKNSSAQLLPVGSVILSSRAPIGYVAINTVEMATNQGCRNFICGTSIFNKYLYYFLIFNTEYLNSLGSGSTFLEVSGSRLKEIEIPLPPLAEQKKIVKMLDEKMKKIAEMKKLREASLADTEKILSQILHEIFEEGKQKGWKEKRFDDEAILKMTSGGTPSRGDKSFYTGKILWLKSGELQDNMDIKESEEKISEEAVKKSSAKIFPKGTVLFAMYGATAGKIGILGVEASTNQAVAGMIPVSDKLEKRFLYYFLMKKREEIVSQAWGGAQPNLSQTILKTFSIPLPSLFEQQKIVKRLNTLSEKIRQSVELQKSQLEDLKKLEKSYLRAAFNGEL